MEIVAEKWRTLACEFAGWPYEVSNLGRVRSNWTGRIMRTYVDRDGYRQLGLTSLEKRAKSARVHRLVAMAFVAGYSPQLEVNHKNGEKQDNAAANLEWLTKLENLEHAVATGRKRSVGACPRKLTTQQASAIRLLMRRGVSQPFLARWFGVTQAAISCIRRNITYREAI